MKRYSKPSTEIPAPTEGAIEDFDVVKLLDKTKEVLRREVTNLLMESSSKKLKSESAKDLVNYIKLLNELQAEEEKKIKGMSKEQLEKLTSE